MDIVRWELQLLFVIIVWFSLCFSDVIEMKQSTVGVEHVCSVTVTFQTVGNPVYEDIYVNLIINGESGSDFEFNGVRVKAIIADYATEATATITIINDHWSAQKRTFTVSIEPGDDYTVGARTSTTVTVISGDACSHFDGSIVSPGFPGKYDNYQNFLWLFASSYYKRIMFKFTFFALESDDDCIYDVVEIRHRRHNVFETMGRFCGGSLPTTLTSEGTAVVYFSTDLSITYKGFKLVYTHITAYDCRRPGQRPCEHNAVCNAGVCDCESLDPKRAGYKCDYLKDDIMKSPCTAASCTGVGTCVGEGGVAKCYCAAPYEDTDSCLVPRYRVKCEKDEMYVQVNPIGDFIGKVYAYGHEDTCTFEDFANQAGMPSDFRGKVRIIPNVDTACGNASQDIVDNVLRVSRLIYVQYHSNFKTALDESFTARCIVDFATKVNKEFVIGPIKGSRKNIHGVQAGNDFNPLHMKITKDGGAITSGASVSLKEKLDVVMFVKLAKEFGAFLVRDITLDNNFPEDLISTSVIKDSCQVDGLEAIMSTTSSLMVTSQNEVLQIKFELHPIKFKHSDDLRIIVVMRLCPTDDITMCQLPSCTGTVKRKRSTDKYDNATVDFVLKVYEPLIKNELSATGTNSSVVSAASEDGDGLITAAFIVVGVLGLVFLVVGVGVLVAALKRKQKSKVENIPSHLTFPTKPI